MSAFAPHQDTRGRRERILSYTLVEVLITLVFIAAAYGVVAANEGDARVEAIRERLVTLERERDAARRERDALAETNRRYERWLRRLWAAIGPDAVFPARPEMDEAMEDLLRRIEQARADIRRRIGPGAGNDPACDLGAQFLFELEAMQDGRLRVSPTGWSPDAAATLRAIPGVSAIEGATVTLAQFAVAASQIEAAAHANHGCRFRAVLRLGSPLPDAPTYVRQLNSARDHFYVATPDGGGAQ